MGMHSGKQKQIKAVAAAFVWVAAVGGLFGDGGAFYCEAKTNDAEKEVVDFVTAYYEAHTPEGLATLADYVMEPESMNFQLSLVSMQTLFDHGVTGWENIDVMVYPLSDGEHWIASVSSDMVVSDPDVAIPGLKVELTGRDADGALKLVGMDTEETLSDAMLNEIREISLSDAMVDRNNEVAMQYSGLIADDSEVVAWILEASEEADRARVKAYERISRGLSAQKDTDKETEDGKGDRYVVKKGDCLWSIAEKQLGDGMRWSGIYETNKAVIGEDPNLIYVGIELELK